MRATAAVAGAVLAALVAVGCGSAVTDPERSAQAAMPDLLGASSPSPDAQVSQCGGREKEDLDLLAATDPAGQGGRSLADRVPQ